MLQTLFVTPVQNSVDNCSGVNVEKDSRARHSSIDSSGSVISLVSNTFAAIEYFLFVTELLQTLKWTIMHLGIANGLFDRSEACVSM